MLFDSHCHLDDPRLRPHLAELISEANRAGISAFLVPGVAPSGWNGILDLANSFPGVIPALGVHPMHAELLTPDVLSELRRLSRFAAAIGEIGLDYALDAHSQKVQKDAFRAQLAVATEAGLPVLIHCRKAFGDLLEILEEQRHRGIQGVMHAFSGSPESAHECLRLGLHISLAGPVTYDNAVRPVAVAKSVPLERLLVETDAPDLAPVPHRGGLNRPSYLVATARKIAEVRGIDVAKLARATSDNASRLFRLGPQLQWPGDRSDNGSGSYPR